MCIVRWNLKDIPDLERYGFVEMLTELDADGVVLREMGLNSLGEVVHKAPMKGSSYPHGFFFDGATVDMTSLSSDEYFSRKKFEAMWSGLGASA